jgi:hypothetical protein
MLNSDALQVLVQSRGGQESITDLGAQGNIDAAKARWCVLRV